MAWTKHAIALAPFAQSFMSFVLNHSAADRSASLGRPCKSFSIS